MRPANTAAHKMGSERTWAVLRIVGRYLWPEGEVGLRCRVVVAGILLIAAKVANVYVPVVYKHAIDALGDPKMQAVAVPVALILAQPDLGVAQGGEQASGVARIGETVTLMDQATQQNAALVEELAAASGSLSGQAGDLVQAVAVFKLGDRHGADQAPRKTRAARAPVPAPALRKPVAPRAAIAPAMAPAVVPAVAADAGIELDHAIQSQVEAREFGDKSAAPERVPAPKASVRTAPMEIDEWESF